ncbi:uroporphyrinogen decarboxylase family protein [Roseixanthobacter glucoisosaccharinicivorans]|uniref:uroporphyrinogen decarboxylase family protein n=1 Tax=Roseixanthobacter glucoisosaccharinicivorans TaxID=3119923 RepID=UPI003726FAFE
MTPRQRLAALLAGRPTDRLLVDVGTSTLTASRPRARPCPGDGRAYGDPVMHLPILTDAELAALGSQTRRCGPAFPGAVMAGEDSFTDRDGVTWIWADGEPAPLRHPLAEADIGAISRAARVPLPPIVGADALADAARTAVVVADVPSPGLIDTAFRLRGYYELLDDTAQRLPVANALLDRAADLIAQDYRTILGALPGAPDLVVYGDDLAYRTGLYLSEERFAFLLRPRMARLFSVIRSQTRAPVLFHSCGAIAPILDHILMLGVRVLNFDPTAAGMDIAAVRAAAGPDVVFHGLLDFPGIARALCDGDRTGLVRVLDDIRAGWPMIAAPRDNLPADCAPGDIRAVTAFLDALDLPRLLAGDVVGALDAATDAAALPAL